MTAPISIGAAHIAIRPKCRSWTHLGTTCMASADRRATSPIQLWLWKVTCVNKIIMRLLNNFRRLLVASTGEAFPTTAYTGTILFTLNVSMDCNDNNTLLLQQCMQSNCVNFAIPHATCKQTDGYSYIYQTSCRDRPAPGTEITIRRSSEINIYNS